MLSDRELTARMQQVSCREMTDMSAQTLSVTIQVEFPAEDYRQLEAQARQEHVSVSQIIPDLVTSELRRRKKARRLLAEASRSYLARLAKEGKLDQTPEGIFAELRAVREVVADELLPR